MPTSFARCRHPRLPALAAVAATLFGCASSDEEAGGLKKAERTFIADAVPHHHLGMELVEIAGPRAHDVRFRRLVFVQGQYHGKEIYQLEQWAEQYGVVPAADGFPGDLDDEVLAELRAMSGVAFDIAWLRAMIEHHEGYLVFADRAAAANGAASIDRFAERTAEVQREQIAEMTALVKELTTA